MSRSRREAWAERMARFQNCSLTVKEFCLFESVSVPSFYQWRRRLAPAKNSPAFISVSLNQPHRAGVATLRLPGGATIELDQTLDTDGLRRMIQAVVDVTTRKATGDEVIR